MSSNIETIENVLLTSAKPLTGEELSALTSVKKSSITSAINRLSQRRVDLYRTSHAGRSYYAIGQEKFQGPLALSAPSHDVNDAPKGRAVRDRNGKFVKRSCAADTSQFKLFDTDTVSEAVEISEDRAVTRRRMARMDEQVVAEQASNSTAKVEEASLEVVSSGSGLDTPLAEPVEMAVVQDFDSPNQSLVRHRQELLEAMETLKKEQQAAAVKRIVRSEAVVQNKVTTVTNPDLFRGWFNPSTGVRAERLGLDA